MLQLNVPLSSEGWDEEKEEFVFAEEELLQLEHSLVSISKWESKWCKPFLTKDERSPEEIIDYIKCMTINADVNPNVYRRLTKAHFEQINDYISAPMTATTFYQDNMSKGSREVITSELIYYWMIALTIPIDECQHWHLNRLLTLIRICNIKNSPPKKQSKADIMRRNAELNAQRRARLNSKG